MSEKKEDPTISTDPELTEIADLLDRRLRDIERRLGMAEGNVDAVANKKHSLVKWYYRHEERLRRIEKHLGLRSPAMGEPLTPEEAAAGDSPLPVPKEDPDEPPP